MRDELPQLERIYVIDAPDGALPDGVAPASELMTARQRRPRRARRRNRPADIATLIYTRGTTGPPKGVMISQYNVVYTVEQLLECLPFDDYAGCGSVSYLPMAHIAERMTSHYQPLIAGFSVYCCPEADQLTTYLKEVHPQLVFGVPRVFEKIYSRRQRRPRRRPRASKAQFDDGVAVAIEIKRAELRRHGHRGAARHVGVPRCRGVRRRCAHWSGSTRSVTAISGAAPIPADDPRVVRRDRCAAVGDLRDVRVERADDVVSRAQQARLRRPGDPGLRGGRSPTTAR